MSRFKVVMNFSDGTSEEADEICETEAEAEEFGSYLSSCSTLGAEILHLHNPGDYPSDESSMVDFEVIEVDE